MQVRGPRPTRSNFYLRPGLEPTRAQAQQYAEVGAAPDPKRNRKPGPA